MDWPGKRFVDLAALQILGWFVISKKKDFFIKSNIILIPIRIVEYKLFWRYFFQF